MGQASRQPSARASRTIEGLTVANRQQRSVRLPWNRTNSTSCAGAAVVTARFRQSSSCKHITNGRACPLPAMKKHSNDGGTRRGTAEPLAYSRKCDLRAARFFRTHAYVAVGADEEEQRRITMAGLNPLVAAALISAISATAALAQEPATFQAMYPDRDLLNRGAPTPASKLSAADLQAANAASAGLAPTPNNRTPRARR